MIGLAVEVLVSTAYVKSSYQLDYDQLVGSYVSG